MSPAPPTPGWARSSGHVRVGLQEPDDSPRHDRVLVAERIARYGWSYDERDRAGLADCFTADGVWEGTVMGVSSVGPFRGREGVTDFLAGFWLEQVDQRRHLFANVVVHDLTGVAATAHAYLLLTAARDGIMTPVTTGPYRFELVKDEDAVWRIDRLVAGFDATF